MKYLVGILLAIAILISVVQSTSFSYSTQNKWPGVCTRRSKYSRQSPINIITRRVTRKYVCPTPIKLSSSYFSPVDGTFVNNGHSVQFTPDKRTVAQMTTPDGNYNLLQFHFHWGRTSGQGTEHQVNGKAADFEVHFVHKNKSPNVCDAVAVLAVRGYVSPGLASMGIFSKLKSQWLTNLFV